MQRILVVNSKGGCGKTTLATNLASYYASRGFPTALIDHDPQGSSMRWLSERPIDRPAIHGIAAGKRPRSGVTMAWHMRMPLEIEKVIVDAPAGVCDQKLIEVIKDVNAVVIPILPSPIDIHAASRFIEELLLVARVRQQGIRIGVVANRVRDQQTQVYQGFERFLNTLKMSFITTIRDSQNYVYAAGQGMGIHEMWDRQVESDKQQWQPLIQWLDGVDHHVDVKKPFLQVV